MAILGFHVVISLIALTVLSKFGSRSSFFNLLLIRGLRRYKAPSNEELRALLPSQKAGGGNQARKRRLQREEEEREGFNVPRALPIQLHADEVRLNELERFPLYDNIHWLCVFVPVSVAVFFICEFYCWLNSSSTDTNVSVIWLFVGIGFCLQVLARLTAMILGGEDEKGLLHSMTVLSFFALFVLTVFIDRLFDISLLDAYEEMTKNAAKIVQEEVIVKWNSPLLLYISLVLLFSMISACLIFPSFRYATMYTKALLVADPFTRLLLHITFLLPAVIIALFSLPMKPFLTEGKRKVLTPSQLESLRIYLTLLWCILRVSIRRPLLQAHLDLAYDKVRLLQRQTGRIKNTELQSLIFRYYSYSCAVLGQFLSPTILVLFLALLLKSTADISWTGEPLARQSPPSSDSLAAFFTPAICRAVVSFSLLSTLSIVFSLSLVGVVYMYYFSNE